MGFEHADDAGVVRFSADTALVQTVDFFTPVVDDPYQFGCIAAANALSDVFAMGGTPLSALNIVCFPSKDLSTSVLREILAGGHDKLREAGGVLAGGHTVRDKELKYGLAVTGVVHPEKIWANQGALPGDVLILTKPIGTGILTTAFKRGAVTEADLVPAVDCMARLNKSAMEVAADFEVHACTDVTGNGLAGHAWEMAKSSNVLLRFSFGALPLLPNVVDLCAQGFLPGGARSNGRYLGAAFTVNAVDEVARDILLDPQTSGGLLLSVPGNQGGALLQRLKDAGLPAAMVGEVVQGTAGIELGV